MRRWLVVLSVIVSILITCGFYLGQKILHGSSTLALHPDLVWTGVTVFLCLVLLGPLLSRILPERVAGRYYVVRWTINMMMAVFFATLFYMLTFDLLLFILSFGLPTDSLATIQTFALRLLGAFVIVTLTVGSLQALRPKVYRIEVPLKGLPERFDGFTIAQISDLHIGELIGQKYVRNVVATTNALKPNLIALTGDIIDGAAKLVAPIAACLSDLQATDGTFYVTGNHEYYWGVQSALEAIEKAGAKILLNEHVQVRRGANEIVIAGVTDISAGSSVPGHQSDPRKSVAGVAKDKIKILLAHQPVSYRQALEAGFDLQLSGHTHGGQFFPWSLVVRMFQRYNKGLIRHEHLWIYVNRGTATWGPRLRFGIPPEITLLTLRRES